MSYPYGRPGDASGGQSGSGDPRGVGALSLIHIYTSTRRRYAPRHTQYPQLCKSLWISSVHRG